MKKKHARLLIIISLTVIVLLAFIAAGFIYGFDTIPPLFVVFFLPFLFYTGVFYLIYRLTAGLFWIFLPSSIKQNYRNSRRRFRSIFFFRTFFLIVFLWLLNHFIFDYSLNPASILGNISLFLFFILSDIVFFNPGKAARIFLYISGVLIFIAVFLSFIQTNPQASSSTGDSEILKSLPYADWSPAEVSVTQKGVVKFNPEKAYKGINIFFSKGSSEVQLLDMEGKILHAWKHEPIKGKRTDIAHAEVLPNGDILFIGNGTITRAGWDSQTRWITRLRTHHDIALSPEGNIATLTEAYEVLFYKVFPIILQNNHLVLLSEDGRIQKDLNLYKLLKKDVPSDVLSGRAWFVFNPRAFAQRIIDSLTPPRDIYGKADIFHCNTVEFITRNVNPVFKKGRILFCSKRLNMIGLVDLEKESVVWRWGKEELQYPHHPTLLDNNNILVFDNGNFREYSRILEIEPISGKIVWFYEAEPPRSFYSSWSGSNQRLPNGNTLITDSDSGRAFEITREGEIVWEFLNPVVDEKNNSRANIFRMMRIVDFKKYPFLKDPAFSL
ncbi:MAG: hypothetical protein JXB26_20330 [Candidatus Aminicenantes bacterium]|nr:hypothetical protein [Candidatus Aminicenantes bacterium]